MLQICLFFCVYFLCLLSEGTSGVTFEESMKDNKHCFLIIFESYIQIQAHFGFKLQSNLLY